MYKRKGKEVKQYVQEAKRNAFFTLPNGMKLSAREKMFCDEYIKTFNAADALVKAGYRITGSQAQSVYAWKLKTNPAVKAYLEQLKEELAEVSQISRYSVLQEYAKIAFSNITDFHSGWMTLAEYDSLTPEKKAAIAEIKYVQKEEGVFVSVKLHDKVRALDSIARMLGYDAPTKILAAFVNPPVPVVNIYNLAPPLARSESDVDIKKLE